MKDLLIVGLLVGVGVLAALHFLGGDDETEEQRVAEELTENLGQAHQRADSLEDELEVERARADSLLTASREREVVFVEVAREAEQEKVEAGADLRETILSIPDPEVRDTALTQLVRLEEAQQQEVTALRSVNDELRIQMQAMVELQAATDSARVGWMERALAEQATREAWQRAFDAKRGAGLSLMERFLPEGKAQEFAKGVGCLLFGGGIQQVTGDTGAGVLAAGSCGVGALIL